MKRIDCFFFVQKESFISKSLAISNTVLFTKKGILYLAKNFVFWTVVVLPEHLEHKRVCYYMF